MDKETYFKQAIAHSNYYKKAWILDAFATCVYDAIPTTNVYPYQLVTLADYKRYAMVPKGDRFEAEPVTGASGDLPLFDRFEKVKVTADWGIPNYVEDVESTYGNILRNLILLCYPFGKKIPFQASYQPSKIEGVIAGRLTDEPADGQYDDTKFYPSEYIKYSEAVGMIRGLAYVFSPSGSEKTLTVSEAVVKLRDEMFKQYRDRLKDPAIIAEIAQKLVEADKAWFKGDESEGFFIKGKQFDVIRMQMFFMLGNLAEISDEIPSDPITTSLLEKWKPEQLPAFINALRQGSYSRGKQTELGGTVVKLLVGAFKDTKVLEDDCGATHGISITVRKEYISSLEGLYLVGGKAPITKEEIQASLGKTLEFRTPMLCRAKNNKFCKHCIGGHYSKLPGAVSVAAMNIGSIFMGVFMKAMKGKSMVTRAFDTVNSFT